jgi:hypothetical protein
MYIPVTAPGINRLTLGMSTNKRPEDLTDGIYYRTARKIWAALPLGK